MSLFSLIAALFLEQFRPLPNRLLLEPVGRYADFLEARLNAGESRHGLIAWLVAVLPPVLLAGGIYYLLCALSPLLGWVWNALVLYLTMGFRQFSHHFTDIHLALRMGDVPRARQLLAEWRGRSAEGLSSSEVARLAIEEALAASHRHVFAVVLWFVILPGPCGAVLYRLAGILAERWGRRPAAADEDFGQFGKFSQQIFAIIDWLPLRTTASAFAVVGNFEDAVYCWRTQAGQWADHELGIVLSSGAGALGVRLGQPLVEGGEVTDRAELGVGEEADVDFMQSAVGLVWRALVLWLLLLLLIGLAVWVG